MKAAGMNNEKFSVRQTPAETPQEWAYLWSAAEKTHSSWFVVRILTAIGGSWKVIGVGLIIGIALGGNAFVEALGKLI